MRLQVHPDSLVAPFMAGSHLHYPQMPPCQQCEAENEAFDTLFNYFGDSLEEQLQALDSVKAYNRRWPYDQWAYLNELDGAYLDAGVSVFEATPPLTPEEDMMDAQAVEELLEELSPRQRKAITGIAEGKRPVDIAEESKGERSSGSVRQDIMSVRELKGAPKRTQMRRVRK